MKKVIYPFFDNYDILQNDLQSMEDYRVDEIKSLIEAIMSSKGVASGFTVSAPSATGFTVTTGVAYSGDGERIEKMENEVIVMTGYDVTKTYYLMCKYLSQTTTPQQNPVSGLSADTRQENLSPKISNGGLWVSATDESTTLEYVCLGTITYSAGLTQWTLNTNTTDRNVFAVYSQSIELPLESVTHVNIGTASRYFGNLFIGNTIQFEAAGVSTVASTLGEILKLSSTIGVQIDAPVVDSIISDLTDIGSTANRFKDGYFNRVSLRGISPGLVDIFGYLSLNTFNRIASDSDIQLDTAKSLFFGANYYIGWTAGQGIKSAGDFLPDTDGGFNLGSPTIPRYWNIGYFNNLMLKDGTGAIDTIGGELVLKGTTNLRLNPDASNIYLGAVNTYWFNTSGQGNLDTLFLTGSIRTPKWLYTADAEIDLVDVATDTILMLKNSGAVGRVLKTRYWYDAGKYYDVYTDSASWLNFKSSVDAKGLRLYRGAAGAEYLEISVDGSGYGLIKPVGSRLQFWDNSTYINNLKSLIGFSYRGDYLGEFQNRDYTNDSAIGSTIYINEYTTSGPNIEIYHLVNAGAREVYHFSLTIDIIDGANNHKWHVFGCLENDGAATPVFLKSEDNTKAGVQGANMGFGLAATADPYVVVNPGGAAVISVNAGTGSVATTKMNVCGIITKSLCLA